MTKFFKVIQTLKDSLIRNSSSKNYQQPSNYLLPLDFKEELLSKRQKHRRNTINKIQRSIWCLECSLERSFLFQIPLTLTIARGFSSRYMMPPKIMTKAGSRKTSEVDKLTIIPAWMKKTKIKKFQDHIGNVKNKSQNISQNKTLHEFNVSAPKFKITNLINKKSKNVELLAESIKPKRFYKTVMNKIALPHFETKHVVLKKKNDQKELLDSQSVLDDSIKEAINANIPKNYKLIMSNYNKTDLNRNKPAEKSLTLECIKNPPESLVNIYIENNIEKSLVMVSENKSKQPNRNEDRSRIRKHKTINLIPKTDEILLKLKVKRFQKPELDVYIKKLAAKHGKMSVQKSVKPKRIYENNRQRIKYDLDDKYLINARKTDPMTKHVKENKIESKMSYYSKKKLNEFIKNNIENSRLLKKGSNHINQRTTTPKTEEKPKRGTILRKEDSTVIKNLQIEVQYLNKKANAAIKLNSKNGILKDRDKHVLSAEKKNKNGETESSTNIRDDSKNKECKNEPEIKSSKCCQNKISNDHLIPYIQKNSENSLIIVNQDSSKSQNQIIPGIGKTYESSKNVEKFTECKKTDNISQILPNNQSNNKAKLRISNILSKTIKEYPANIENMVGESKNNKTKDQPSGTLGDQSTEPLKNKNNEKDQHIALNADTNCKPTEQMKYMKYTPDSPNYICVPKKRTVSCKYKISRGVHSDKPDISTESKKHLRNAQPNFKIRNDIRLNRGSGNFKITTKEATAIHENSSEPSKLESIKIVDKNILAPSKIYKFHCHSEILDYKVYKLDYTPLIHLGTEQSNTLRPNINNILRVNLPLMSYRAIDDKNHTFDSQNQSKSNPEVSSQMKDKNIMQLEEVKNERNHEGKNINKNKKIMHLSNIACDKEKSNFSVTKTVQRLNLEKQIKDENGTKYGVGEKVDCVNDNKIINPQIKKEIYNPEGYNIDYSRRELKKILPFIKKLPNKTTNISSKEHINLESMENKKKQASAIEKSKFEEQKNKTLEEIQLENHIESNSSSSQQLGEVSLPGGIKEKSNVCKSDTKKEIIFPFVNTNKTGMNNLQNEDIMYKEQKKKLVVQDQTLVTRKKQQHKMQLDPKSTSWMNKFHELIINEGLFNKKVKKNVFLMHGFNKVSFLKAYKDIPHVTSEMNMFSKHIPTIVINANTNEDKHSKNRIYGWQILDNDLKAMLYQQLELYNKHFKAEFPETIKQNESIKLYDMFDCTFILQRFKNVSLNCESENFVEENLCPSSTSSNDFEFINKIVPMQTRTKEEVSDVIEKIKTCGTLILEQNPKDTSFIEVLDCRIPMKCIKSMVKESSTDDIGSQMFSLTNSKHMCFYSKYRRNCMGENDTMRSNPKIETKNIRAINKTNIKQDSMTSNAINNSESISKSSFQGAATIPLNMKMLTFQEIYNYNSRKNVGIKNNENNFFELKDKEKTSIETKMNLEKESSPNIKQEDKNINQYYQAGSEPNVCHSFSVIENSNRAEIEPEVLHYMKKLDTLSSGNDFTMISNDIKTLEKNLNEAFLTTEPTQEKIFHGNDSNGYKKKNVSNHNTDEAIKTRNLFLKELSYSTDIKFLGKNNTDLSEIVNECKRGTFEYLTKVVKKHKMDTKNLSSLASSNSHEKLKKSDDVIPSKNHKNLENIIKSSSPISILDSPTLKMTKKKRSIESNISQKVKTKSLKKNVENEYKSGINSNINKVISTELLENSFNKLKVMKKIEEEEKKLIHIRNHEKTLSQINEDCDIISNSKQITSNNKNLETSNELLQEMSHQNISHGQINKTESGLKMKSTTDMNNVKAGEKSFKGICFKTESTNRQNYSNSNRIQKHLNSDNTRTSNNLSKSVGNIQNVSNKKFDFCRILTKNFNPHKGSRNSDKMTESDTNEVTINEQKEFEKMNINEVRKPIIMEYESNDNMTNVNTEVDMNAIGVGKPLKNEHNDVKNIINKKTDVNNSESHVNESIPTGLRCIRQFKIEPKDKGMEKCHLKKTLCEVDSNKFKNRDRKHTKSPLRKDIGKSVTLAKLNLTADCDTTSKLNHYLSKHKKKLEAITEDKRVKSIKHKLSNNLKPRDESSIIRRESHTLMSFLNAENDKKKGEENKRDSKKGKEDGLHLHINGINKTVPIKESKEQTITRNKIGRGFETRNFSSSNSFFDSKSNPIKISTEAKKPYFNIICSANKFKQINEYKVDKFSKVENMELNLTQQLTNFKKEKNKETNNIGSRSSLHCLKKINKSNKKKQYRENPIYILKYQPKLEGFISQSLRPSNSQKSSYKMHVGTVKKRQAGHVVKNRIKSELKQSATNSKKKKSKHPKIDMRFKNDQKKNKINLKLASSSAILSQKGLPLHVFQNEENEICKNYFLDTPSRLVCGLTQPRQTPNEKPVMPKAKATTKLFACTQKKDDILKQNFKLQKNVENYNEHDDSFITKIHNMKPEIEYKPTFTEMGYETKGNTSEPNLVEYQFEKTESGVLKDESKDQNTNLRGTKDLISDIELIIDQRNPAAIPSETIAKVPDRNDSSNCELITNSKDGVGLHAIVGNVVNNVKARIQNFLLADIAESKLNKEIISKKMKQQKSDYLKEKSDISKIPKQISRETNRFKTLNQNTKQILSSTLASYSNGVTDQIQSNKNMEKKKIISKNKDSDDGQRRKPISDLLKFKSARDKQTCPQRSYSEVLNEFYATCET
ncbi:unnamed protein product [Nezara viridula]|uniref:Uncharacterized protein n=1 Tax=Nezara viridula TaxID=85310 RepID=A0A9P0E881_NEZVI|nr:unnamed protein product [Nezara viridula]